MSTTIKNMAQLCSAGDKYLYFAVNHVANKIKNYIDEFIRYYYGEYTPEVYHRTWKFLNSIIKTEPQKVGNGYQVSIYVDTSIHYSNGYSMQDVAESANQGYHGWKVRVSDSLHFWDDAMLEIKDKQIVTDEFVKFLTDKGIKIVKR